jgi:DNA sulfur modification protein DndD
MKLESLTLHNYGIYKGEHTIDLRTTAGKPIILIGAMNGSGKTTLLEAIQLCLLGRAAKFIASENVGYHGFLKNSINRNSKEDSASISLVFSDYVGGERSKISVCRTWTSRARGVQENVQVWINNELNQDASERWTELVEQFIPSQLSDLFFFDGERIEELAEPSRCSEMLKVGMTNLLGLDVIGELLKSMSTLDRRMSIKDIPEELKVRLDHSSRQKDDLSKEVDTLLKERLGIDTEAQLLRSKIEALKITLEKSGGVLFNERAGLKDAFDDRQKRMQSSSDALRVLAESSLPLALLETNLKDLLTSLTNAITPADKALLMESLGNVRKRLISEMSICGETSSVSAEAFSRLFDAVADAEVASKTSVAFSCSRADIRGILKELGQQKGEGLRFCVELANLSEQLEQIRAKLDAVPEESKIRPLFEELADLEGKLGTLDKSAEALKLQEMRSQQRLLDCEKRISSLEQEARSYSSEQILSEAMKKQLKRGRDNLEIFAKSVMSKHVSRLEQHILESLKKLFRKANYIESVSIDPDSYLVSLKIVDQGVVPAEQLSAGERQLLATAILWSLAKASPVELPTVIDTPLGRLDSAHRTTIVENYFPHVSKQVILLSTDEEIVGRYYSLLEGKISREYTLAFDETEQTTKILPGYIEQLKEAA